MSAMDNRRVFIKNIAIAGAAAMLMPDLTRAAEQTDGHFAADPSKTYLFQGDSITDGGRSFDKDWNHVYGQGYAYLITSRLTYDHPGRTDQYFNRGKSGNTVADLTSRWQKDTLDIRPDVLSILIGVNDVHAIVEKGEKASAVDFNTAYDALLAQTIKALPGIKLILCEPFILPVGMVSKKLTAWTTELKQRQEIVAQLAVKYNTVYVPLQKAFDRALLKAPAEHWIWDGVHPMPAGHELIAREWLKRVK